MSLHELAARWREWIVAGAWQMAVLIVVIGVVTRGLQSAAPKLRYGLWLLVLVKVFLPPTLTVPWSLGQWAVMPLVNSFQLATPSQQNSSIEESSGRTPLGGSASITTTDDRVFDPRVVAFLVWASGAVGLLTLTGAQCVRLRRWIRTGTRIEEGPLRVALEQAAMRLGLKKTPDLIVLPNVRSPFLIGVIRPCIVLPDDAHSSPDSPGLPSILAHELIHWQRRDPWIGWIQVLVQAVYWFHPFVWWANAQLRHERECVCDAEVLRQSATAPADYAESIVQRLTATQGRWPAFANVVGVLEHGSHLQIRLEQIMNFESRVRLSGLALRGLLVAFAIVLLPMAPHPQPLVIEAADKPAQEKPSAGAAANEPKEKPPYPVIVSTTPMNGDTEVDPGLEWVTVTFDRDMGKGMSWTGQLPADKSRKASWTDKRTCRLPVSLSQGEAYRIGINSKSFNNFTSKSGKPALPAVILFTTKGASDEVKQQIAVPKIVTLEPANGATDVDPAITQLKVTFDIPMGDGMSWTGGGESFPTTSEGQQAEWSEDHLTCTLPVKLQPGHSYKLGINSPNHRNFQSSFGVPAEAVVYEFTTRK
jgi:beta-lactamase regulating signal transducer with metallopeptidase domain